MLIPEEIRDLVLEAISPQNDGYTMTGARQVLGEIRDFIDDALQNVA